MVGPMLKPGAVGFLVLDTRWANSPECQVRFLKEPFPLCPHERLRHSGFAPRPRKNPFL